MGSRRAVSSAGRGAVLFHIRDRLAHLRHLATLLHDLRQHAVGRGGQLGRRLVAFDLDERFVLAHRLANALQPSADLHLGDRFADRRYF